MMYNVKINLQNDWFKFDYSISGIRYFTKVS